MKETKADKYRKAAAAFLKWMISWAVDAISKVFKNKYVIAIIKYMAIPFAIAVVGGYVAGYFISDFNHDFDEQKRAELVVNGSTIYFQKIVGDGVIAKRDQTDLKFNFNLTAKRHVVNVYKVRVYYFDENLSKVDHAPSMIDNLQSGWEIIPELEGMQFAPFVEYRTTITPRMKRCLVIIYYEDYKGFREPIKCYYKLNITEEDVSGELSRGRQIGTYVGTSGWDC